MTVRYIPEEEAEKPGQESEPSQQQPNDTTTVKKNKDFSNSAVNLGAPEEVMHLLAQLHAEQNVLADFKEQLKEQCRQLIANIENQENSIGRIETELKGAIDKYGSYQDVESGHYAVVYKSIRKSYDGQLFMLNYPQLAPAVVTDVNVKVLEGMLLEYPRSLKTTTIFGLT